MPRKVCASTARASSCAAAACTTTTARWARRAFRAPKNAASRILKANGYNAIRTSHNPPSPAFLDACDRLGMLVIDEAFDCWEDGSKNPDDYHLYFKDWWQRDLTSMILRDRNHPSVVLWSIGNEINERAEPQGIEIGKHLAAFVHKLDPTRKVTAAICRSLRSPGPDMEGHAAGIHLSRRGRLQLPVDGVREGPRQLSGRGSWSARSPIPGQSFQNWRGD